MISVYLLLDFRPLAAGSAPHALKMQGAGLVFFDLVEEYGVA